MCCGRKRSTLRSASPSASSPPLRQSAAGAFRLPGTPQQGASSAAMSHSGVPLRYSRNTPVRVRGPITGRQYEFTASAPVQAVDPKDATALLRSAFFRRQD